MANKVQLIAQLRFALEQLSERNAQHEWEHFCRHLARERICSNILPATGPVQAGGDQGRDFETFRTFLQRSVLKERSFVGLVSDKPLAFACTLEKSLAPKVRRDVETIMASGVRVEGIYVLCTRGMAVAKRHELQEWARTNHDVTLEILDGESIAELVSDRELFWLAERYLQLPSELLPALPVEEDTGWYPRILEKWRRETRTAQTFADFSEIRAAARHALGTFVYDVAGRPINQFELPELPFWIERLDEIANEDTLPQLRRRAFYESCVLRLRGLGSLIGQEYQIRAYFTHVKELENAGDLERAEVLLTYVLPASRHGEVEITSSELTNWFSVLRDCVDERIREAKQQERKNEWCALLEVRGHLALYENFDGGVFSAASALKYWAKLAKVAVHAPFFPLEAFADRLAQYAQYIGAEPDYEPLTRAIDALLAERFGQFKTAEKCLERAKSFLNADDLPRAMAQLHRAKVDWFAQETLGEALMALSFLSRAYAEQGLFFAAKYYALAAAYVVLQNDNLHLKPQLAHALERAAACDYAVGAWRGFLSLAETASIFYPHFVHDYNSDLDDPNSVLLRLMFHLSIVPVATQILHPTLSDATEVQCTRIAARLGLGNEWEQAQQLAKTTFSDEDKLWEAVQEQLAGPPWSDVGPIRRTQWKAHGVTWHVQWANDYETTCAVEEFLAALQIFLSDLAGYDLCLLRSQVNVTFNLENEDNIRQQGTTSNYFQAHFEPSNVERQATVTLPPYQKFDEGTLSRRDLITGTLSVATSLLEEVSVLPTDRFIEILNVRFAQGLSNKLLIAAPYSQCLQVFLSKGDFDGFGCATMEYLPSDKTFSSQLPDKLPWYDGPRPNYTPENARRAIRNRYESFSRRIPHTLRRLAQESAFQATLAHLREAGWKDWHILSAVYHVTMNARLNRSGVMPPKSYAEWKQYQQMMREPEAETAQIVSIEEFTKENLRQQMPVYMGAVIKSWELELHQLTPDFPAIEDFLSKRYNFWTDDVEHDDPFAVTVTG